MKPLLAGTATEEFIRTKLKFPCYGFYKLDGIRGIVQNAELVSRKLIAIPNKYTQKVLGDALLNDFDGELIVGPPNAEDVCRASTSALMRHEGEPEVSYYVFDLVDGPGRSYKERYEDLMDRVEGLPLDLSQKIHLLPYVELNSPEDVFKFEEEALTLGYEGIMLRSPDGIYKFGRSTLKEQTLLKFKRFSDAEAQIIGFNERLHNANEATKDNLGRTKRSTHMANLVPMGTLGSLRVRDTLGREFTVKGKIDDTLAREIWDNKEKYLGRWITFKSFDIGVKDLPRFPVFKCFRNVEIDS